MNYIDQIKQATIAGNMPQAIGLTDLALKSGIGPEEVIQQGLIPPWNRSAISLPPAKSMEMTIIKLAEADLRECVKILVGGAPVSQRFANEIGVDGYAANAGEAVKLAKKLLA